MLRMLLAFVISILFVLVFVLKIIFCILAAG